MAAHDATKSVAEIVFENEILQKQLRAATLTLRDHFAMTALQGLVRHYDASVTASQKHAAVAAESYRYADAMLAARGAAETT